MLTPIDTTAMAISTKDYPSPMHIMSDPVLFQLPSSAPPSTARFTGYNDAAASLPLPALSPNTAALAQAAMAAMGNVEDMFHVYDRHQYDLATSRRHSAQEDTTHLRHGSISSMLSAPISPSATSSSGASLSGSPTSALTADTISPNLVMDPAHQAEVRRQIHIQSEQKRRAQIKDGFEELRKQLPQSVSKKISKAVILARTTVYLQQLKQHAMSLQDQVKQLKEENERLRLALLVKQNSNAESRDCDGIKGLEALFPSV